MSPKELKVCSPGFIVTEQICYITYVPTHVRARTYTPLSNEARNGLFL